MFLREICFQNKGLAAFSTGKGKSEFFFLQQALVSSCILFSVPRHPDCLKISDTLFFFFPGGAQETPSAAVYMQPFSGPLEERVLSLNS